MFYFGMLFLGFICSFRMYFFETHNYYNGIILGSNLTAIVGFIVLAINKKNKDSNEKGSN